MYVPESRQSYGIDDGFDMARSSAPSLSHASHRSISNTGKILSNPGWTTVACAIGTGLDNRAVLDRKAVQVVVPCS